jgi:hypothetical protein
MYTHLRVLRGMTLRAVVHYQFRPIHPREKRGYGETRPLDTSDKQCVAIRLPQCLKEVQEVYRSRACQHEFGRCRHPQLVFNLQL